MNILDKVSSELQKLSKDPNNLRDNSIFHKDGKDHVEIMGSLIRKVASKYFREVSDLEKKQIFILCEELLNASDHDRQTIAFDWAFRIKKQYQQADFKIFDRWLKQHVDDWGSCDDLCTHAFGEFIYQFPEFLPKIKLYTRSSNRWLRRAAAVVLIYPLRKEKYLENAFDIASTLLQDNDDLVQKGYGWMLKEASNCYPKEVFAYVIQNKMLMPRTALRYAIEKLPAKMKQTAMRKDW